MPHYKDGTPEAVKVLEWVADVAAGESVFVRISALKQDKR